MGPVGLQYYEGGIGTRVDRRHQKVDRAGRVGARRQHKMAPKAVPIPVQHRQPFRDCLSRNLGQPAGDDVTEFTLGMNVDHADLAIDGGATHFPAASRRALIVVRGEMASVDVMISTMAPFGAAQARS